MQCDYRVIIEQTEIRQLSKQPSNKKVKQKLELLKLSVKYGKKYCASEQRPYSMLHKNMIDMFLNMTSFRAVIFFCRT